MTTRCFIKIQPWSMKWEKLSQYSDSLKNNECVDIIRTCTQNSIFSQLAWSCPKTWLTTTVGTYYNSFALLHPGVSRDSHFAESSSCTALFYGALTFGPTRLDWGPPTCLDLKPFCIRVTEKSRQAGNKASRKWIKKWRVGALQALEEIKINGWSSCRYLHILVWKELVFDLAISICHARVPLVHESLPILTWEDFRWCNLSQTASEKIPSMYCLWIQTPRKCIISWILSAIQRNEHKCCSGFSLSFPRKNFFEPGGGVTMTQCNIKFTYQK